MTEETPDETRVGELLAGRDRTVPVPSFAEVRAHADRRSVTDSLRTPVVIGVAVAVIVLGFGVAGFRAVRPGESTAASTASVAPTTAVRTDTAPSLAVRGGFIVTLTGDQLGIRREQTTDLVRSFTTRRFAVSPDGRQLAYWQTGPEDALPHVLHVVDLGSGQDHAVFTLTNERAGSAGWLVWSADNNSLALAIHDPASAFEGRSAPRLPAYSSVRLLDLHTGQLREVMRTTNAWLVPVAWEAATGRIAAIARGTDDATRTYIVYDPSGGGTSRERTLVVSVAATSVQANSAGDRILAIERTPCAVGTCGNVWVWPTNDPTMATRASSSGANAQSALFRPGTTEAFSLLLEAGGTSVVERAGAGHVAPSQLARFSTRIARVLFRSDGSALFATPADLNDHSASVIDPDSGARATFALASEAVATVTLP